MVIKFFKHGKAGDPVGYLTSPLKHQGLKVYGDAELTKSIIKSSKFSKKYTSGVICATETDLTEAQKQNIRDEFEKLTFAGVLRENYNCLWVEHQEKGKTELHFVIPEIDLSTGKRFQTYYDKVDRHSYVALRNFLNRKYSCTSPEQADRAALMKKADISLKAKVNNLKNQEIESLLHTVIGDRIDNQTIQNRVQIIEYLKGLGFAVTRIGDTYISVKSQDMEKAIRLKGECYGRNFTGIEGLRTKLRDREKELDSISNSDIGKELTSRTNYRAAKNQKLYAGSTQTAKAENTEDRGEDRGTNISSESDRDRSIYINKSNHDNHGNDNIEEVANFHSQAPPVSPAVIAVSNNLDNFAEVVMEDTNFKKRQKDQIQKLFTTLCFSDLDTICVTVIKDGKSQQRFLPLSEIDKYIGWLGKENAQGANIYFAINKLKEGATARKAEDYKEKQQILYFDLDSKTEDATPLLKKAFELIGEPTMLIRSSQGNYQGYYVLEAEIGFERAELMMKSINTALNIDKTQDIARIFRMPGFFNRKKLKGDLSYIVPAINGKEIEKKLMSIDRFEELEKKLVVSEVKEVKKQQSQAAARTAAPGNASVSSSPLKPLKKEHIFFRSKIGSKYLSDSEADMAYSIWYLSRGGILEDLKQYLLQVLSHKHEISTIELTIKKASNYLARQQALEALEQSLVSRAITDTKVEKEKPKKVSLTMDM